MQSSPVSTDQLLQGLSESHLPQVQKAVADVVALNKAALANTFYAAMAQDPAATKFFSTKSVEERLKPSMERWLEQLFCHETPEELQGVLVMQRHIGEVHSRANIPAELVSRGMRLIKREIIQRLLETGLSRDELISAVLRTDRLIDIAFEAMS
jgi:diguanylate cyclase